MCHLGISWHLELSKHYLNTQYKTLQDFSIKFNMSAQIIVLLTLLVSLRFTRWVQFLPGLFNEVHKRNISKIPLDNPLLCHFIVRYQEKNKQKNNNNKNPYRLRLQNLGRQWRPLIFFRLSFTCMVAGCNKMQSDLMKSVNTGKESYHPEMSI